MKDKLVRYHHKAAYYKFKKVCIGCSIFVVSSILVALPISFGLNMVKANEIAKTEKANTNLNVEYLHF